jgi:hypothetical protein
MGLQKKKKKKKKRKKKKKGISAVQTEGTKLIQRHTLLQASERVAENLGAVRSSQALENFTNLSAIAKNVCENGGLVHINPLNF